ncbi:MAG: bifunctional diaminohydroxyphosphoribosylaminopyrimidine deaminase/5-amino-6-(5-phosphoribosylamino)uracil reductase RibD [Lachnospiraceae bacterium]|nr:bifunctional diaminohydroxyphosphoribosylaminopyrimidine deaminase/5-amino-6-(5-phosphoribosylamino)uracil reductase RibD [Lachnospiraceae bacterium]
MTDREYMSRAIELAELGRGWVNPNPAVGAVIVKEGRVIGEGWHERYKGLHAERNAFASLTESAEGADLYVTLEPCCHYGKTPPCTEAIIAHKIRRVVIGSDDPNPKVAGKGVIQLREAGILVETGVMKAECDRLNPVFFHYITTNMPYVVMKYAMTADGKIATKTGASKWITGEKARARVQEMRHCYMGIIAGIGTVLADDPMLNVRLEGKKSPIRIICDSRLRIPLDSKICRSAGQYRTMIACGKIEDGDLGIEKKKEQDADCKEMVRKAEKLRAMGIEVVSLPDVQGRVDLLQLMNYLGSQKIDSVFLEGGGELNDSFLRAGLVQELKVFIAPKIFGGKEAKTPVSGVGVELPDQGTAFVLEKTSVIGEDFLLEYRTE